MLPKLVPLLLLGFVTISHTVPDIFYYMIRDFQVSMVDLTDVSPSSLNPWAFIYAAGGDFNEYHIINGLSTSTSSALSFTTANSTVPSKGLHAQIVANPDSTFWECHVYKEKKGAYNFIRKATGLAMTAWATGTDDAETLHPNVP
ncbi:hypothetical protein K438DRAFT_2010091 [Mycena galopus ATCC 62051]|nr:hypothetical protein K438DRAFT_2010091 [Mycena galopus ATCC 62051]